MPVLMLPTDSCYVLLMLIDSRAKRDKSLARTSMLEEKLNGSHYRNSSEEDIYSLTDSSKTRVIKIITIATTENDNHLSEAATHEPSKGLWFSRPETTYGDCHDRHDYYSPERDHDIRNEYSGRRDDRYGRNVRLGPRRSSERDNVQRPSR